MRRLSLLLLLLLLPIAHADDKDHIVVPAEIHCFKLETLVKQLKDKFGEEPIFLGKSELDANTMTMMFVNQEKGTYTIVGMDKNVGCVYDTGNNIKYRMPRALDNKLM